MIIVANHNVLVHTNPKLSVIFFVTSLVVQNYSNIGRSLNIHKQNVPRDAVNVPHTKWKSAIQPFTNTLLSERLITIPAGWIIGEVGEGTTYFLN